MELDVEQTAWLPTMATVVAIVSYCHRFQYTVGLAVTGVVLSFPPFLQTAPMSKGGYLNVSFSILGE